MYYEYIVGFLIAFIVAFSSTPISRKIAFKLGAVDVPKDDRRMHKKPIARLGGLSIVAGFLVSLFFYVVGIGEDFMIGEFNSGFLFVVMSILIIAFTGIVDDTKGIRPWMKLFLQILAAALIVYGANIRIFNLTNPFVEEGMYVLDNTVSYVVSILWLVGITNAINLIDGLDGLAAGVSAISSFALFFVALITENYFTAGLTIILAGASLGFLPYNFNPAKIFMGDTGSMFLGFTLGVISIQGTFKSFAFISIVIPVIALGLPLFDTTFAILRRMIQGKPIMQADRGHLHHRLIDMGLSQKQSVLVLYTASATLGLSAIVLAHKGLLIAITMVISLFAFVVFGAKYLSEFRNEEVWDLAGEEQDENATSFPLLPIGTLNEKEREERPPYIKAEIPEAKEKEKEFLYK
jgi:UDP-GlcNAc:undecaprenyl-phosphate/decaprenyl-phosphate GlcNAc-1-phosphate transferase